MLFACESFDLAKYKGQSHQLRQMLLSLMESLLAGDVWEFSKEITDRLMQALVKEYSLERYYNRTQDISADF